jgi:hypothetical protein
MKTLSTYAAATALGVDRKTLDNALAREARQLIGGGRRGRSRRIPLPVLERLAIAFILTRDLGVGLARGLDLAEQIVNADGRPVSFGSLGELSFDTARLSRALERSIGDVLESTAEPLRGRRRS